MANKTVTTSTAAFSIGDYTFYWRDDLPEGHVFMQHKDGEGMQISEARISGWLHDLFVEEI